MRAYGLDRAGRPARPAEAARPEEQSRMRESHAPTARRGEAAAGNRDLTTADAAASAESAARAAAPAEVRDVREVTREILRQSDIMSPQNFAMQQQRTTQLLDLMA